MKRILPFILFIAALGGAWQAQAETRYVSDQLEIPMRTGKSTQHRILRMLPSGTPLEVLELDKENGWTRVRTPDGKEGWVLTRLLMDIPAARDRLARAEKRLAELELRDRQRTQNLSATEKEKAGLQAELDRLREENRKLGQQLAEIRRTASSALAIDAENKELKGRLMQMEREQQTLAQENETLRDRTARDWFMVGAGVVVLGILIGLILPRLRIRRRSSWGDL